MVDHVRDEALEYHSGGRPGKTEVVPTKPTATQRDLALAYTPGVAKPCLQIAREPGDVYKYTNKGNLVAVISNGTAVLGLGNIGAAAGKPVMEGKAVLFKRFADIDVFDIELATEDPKEVIRVCQLLEPTFGGINLEDIKAPECFEIEEELRRTLNIPYSMMTSTVRRSFPEPLCSTPWRLRGRKSTRSEWCSTEPARPLSLVQSTISSSEIAAKTSRCVT